MNNIFILLKYNLLQIYNKLTKNLTKKKKRSNLALGGIFAALGIMIYVFVIFYIFLFAMLFKEAGMPEGVLITVISIFSMICLMTTLTQANSMLFRMKDYDLLASLPIKKNELLISKLINIVGLNPIISILLGIPTCIIYGLINNVSGLFYLYTIVIFIFVPFFPIIIGCLLSYIFGFIPMKQKNKNLLSTVLYLGFMVVLLTFSFNVSEDPEELNMQLQGMLDVFEKFNILSSIAVSGMLGNIYNLLLFIGISLILSVGFVFLVSLGFNKIINNMNYNGKSVKYEFKEEHYKALSPTKALLKKEFTLYFSMPNYIMNTVIGAIMSVILTVVFCLKLEDLSGMAELEGLGGSDFYALMFMVVYIFAFGLANTTTASISLEGKNFWILKSLPIDYKPVFKAKVLLNTIISSVFLLIDLILLFILAPFNILVSIGIIVSTFIFVNAGTILGLYLNIKKYDFNCEPIKAIKQNMPVLIICLLTFVYMFVSIIAYILALSLFGVVGLIICGILVNAIYFLVSYLLLIKDGAKSYSLIE